MTVQALSEGPLDIVGDVHGELQALQTLLRRLGYDASGQHPAGRHLVFVGDLCDRGPDSLGVIELVRRIVESARGSALLGNHELNLLRGQQKEGNDWFWGQGTEDQKFGPSAALSDARRKSILEFFVNLPLALERDDLRVVHAAWLASAIEDARKIGVGALLPRFESFETQIRSTLESTGLLARSKAERQLYAAALTNPAADVPLLIAVGQADAVRQMGNPIRVLTSGVERLAKGEFFAGGKWRFVERVRWWDDYKDDIPVVVGHYWRRATPASIGDAGKGGPDLFAGLGQVDWHGANGNVFCIDYSVGARWAERMQTANGPFHQTRLAALRWPEKVVMFDTGAEALPTTGFGRKR